MNTSFDLHTISNLNWNFIRGDIPTIWQAINCIDWKDLSVLDIGCQAGQLSFYCAAAGSKFVHGFDIDPKFLTLANQLNSIFQFSNLKFEQNAINPKEKDEFDLYDVILYLSVHHRFDPDYAILEQKLNNFKLFTLQYMFVELILPPLFGSISEREIDKIIDGKTLLKYQSKARGIRKIYLWSKL